MWKMLQNDKFYILNLCVLMILIWFDIYYALYLIELTTWIDVCQSDGNMLATGGDEKKVNIFDKREAKIVQTFDDIHEGNIFGLFNK